MSCFTPALLENLLIWFLIISFIAAVFWLVVPKVLQKLGGPPGAGTVMTILGWFVGLVIAIAVVIFVFDLINCMSHGPLLRGIR